MSSSRPTPESYVLGQPGWIPTTTPLSPHTPAVSRDTAGAYVECGERRPTHEQNTKEEEYDNEEG